ncbi:MAG: serine hydrolase [Caldilineaceae bacterium]|nr:serine hydrolase [Caldilineaceae bacterium]
MNDFTRLEQLLTAAVPRLCPAAQVVIQQEGQVIFAGAYGWLDPAEQRQATTPTTLFDLASVTKLFVATSFMRLVEAGQVALDQPVVTVLPAFGGERPIAAYEDPLHWGEMVRISDATTAVDAGQVTFRQLLTHTAGLPAWRPLFQQTDRAAAQAMALSTFFAYPIGTQVVYSDIGLILLGMAVETLTGQSLADAVTALILQPLGLRQTRYLPVGTATCDPTQVAPTEQCQWRGRRVVAEVHDENAAKLGGVSGHAGLFSTAAEVARFGHCFLDGGAPLLQPATVAAMRQVQIEAGPLRRGLGFLLWSPDPEASSNPFSQQAFGHTGFTGTSLWIDPTRALVVACLTNEVYYGRVNRQIGPLRVAIHQAIVQSLAR